jgi:hypothetical protein
MNSSQSDNKENIFISHFLNKDYDFHANLLDKRPNAIVASVVSNPVTLSGYIANPNSSRGLYSSSFSIR